MAGQPRKRAFGREVEARGGEDWFFDQLVNGVTIRAMAEALSSHEWGFTPAMIYAWINQEPRRRERLKEARRLRAHVLVDEVVAIADEVSEDNYRSSRVAMGAKQWAAEKLNREELGVATVSGPTVQVNFGSLHLMALRAPAPPRPEALEGRADVLALPA